VWTKQLAAIKGMPDVPPEVGIAVKHRSELAAGVVIYNTTGPFIIFEHLFTMGMRSPRVRHRAVETVVLSCAAYCTAHGKQGITLNRLKGMRLMFERLGVGGRAEGLEILATHLEGK
jgi:hypothetical protein